jgi:hypothetical protein
LIELKLPNSGEQEGKHPVTGLDWTNISIMQAERKPGAAIYVDE